MARSSRSRNGSVRGLILPFFFAATGLAQVNLQTSGGTITVPKDKFHIIIAVGHSNVLGYFGPGFTPDTTPDPRVWNFYTSAIDTTPKGYRRQPINQWVPARAPLHWQSNDNQYGFSNPALYIAKALAKKYPQDHYVGIVSNPETEAYYNKWTSGFTAAYFFPDHLGGGNLYKELMSAAKPFAGKVTFGGFYIDALQDSKVWGKTWLCGLIDSVRKDLQAPHLPFVFSQTPNGAGSWSLTATTMVAMRKIIDSVPSWRGDVGILQTDDIIVASKNHFAPGENETKVGPRVANLLWSLNATVGVTTAPAQAASANRLPFKSGSVFNLRGVRVASYTGKASGVYFAVRGSGRGAFIGDPSIRSR